MSTPNPIQKSCSIAYNIRVGQKQFLTKKDKDITPI